MSDYLDRAVTHFYDEMKREGYRVDRERAGDIHVILVRDWDGDIAGWFLASEAGGQVSIEELQDTAP